LLIDPAARPHPCPRSDSAAIEMMRPNRSRFARLFASAAIVAAIGAATAGCQTTQVADATNSISLAPDQGSDADLHHEADIYGEKYRANPSDVNVALHYAQVLRSTGQHAQAAAVLEQISMQNPHNRAVLGEYGRALAEEGDYQQALQVLDRAHTPDQPDWHILSVQGAVLDQMGHHDEAQQHYLTALKIVPDEPTVLSNLGLSYALSKDLKNAEATLRRAAAHQPVDPRVRQNLALVIGLQGRFAEAESIARADLPPDEAAANVAYLKQMLARKGDTPFQKRAAQSDARSS
jgi:Flp pilus assembly protein TadD